MQRFTNEYGEGLCPDFGTIHGAVLSNRTVPAAHGAEPFDGPIRMWYASCSVFQPLRTSPSRPDYNELMKIPTQRTNEPGKFWLTAGTAIPLTVLLLLLGVFIVLVRNW